MFSIETILVCPLNWGLGHISRGIPVIRRLIRKNFRVIVAGDGPVINFIRSEFPEIEIELLYSKKITYSKKNSQVVHLLRQLPSALIWIWREKKLTAQLVEKYKPVCIISDNRYGIRHPKIKSIIITHQLMLKMPKPLSFLEKPVNKLIKRLVSKFDLCLIPDNPLPDSLAKDLVHKYPLPQNARFIGPLSRFMDDYSDNLQPENIHSEQKNLKSQCSEYDLLALISGPEPQRTILQNKLTEKLSSENIRCLIVAGTLKENNECEFFKNIKIVPHLESSKLVNLLKNIPIIVSRSGYSTIMDLYYLQKNAILIPTPGQTEQEYLASKNVNKNHFIIKQSEISAFNFKECIIPANKSDLQSIKTKMLDSIIDEITEMITINSELIF